MNRSSVSKPLIIHSSGVLKDGGSIQLRTNRGTFYIDNRIASKRADRGGVIWTSAAKGGFGKPLLDTDLIQQIHYAYHSTFVSHSAAVQQSELRTLRELRARYPNA